MKKHLSTVLALFLVLLNGCNNPLTDHGADYASRIHAIYADSAKHTTVYMGEQYHYLFETDDANYAALIQKIGYRLDGKDSIQITIAADGTALLSIFKMYSANELTDDEIDFLLQHGFETGQKGSKSGAKIYFTNFQFSGTRYDGSAFAWDNVTQLASPYTIQGRDFSDGEAFSLAPTPLSSDGGAITYRGQTFAPLFEE